MLRRLILSIRNKPKHVRDNYALGIAGTCTAIVLLVWLYHWPTMMTARSEGRIHTEEGENTMPLSGFFDQAKEQIATARESLEEIATSTDSTDADTSSLVDMQSAMAAGANRSTTSLRTVASSTASTTQATASTTSGSSVLQ